MHGALIVLAIIYLDGIKRISLVHLGYLMLCFYFFWRGQNFFKEKVTKILARWRYLIYYCASVIFVKTCLQVNKILNDLNIIFNLGGSLYLSLSIFALSWISKNIFILYLREFVCTMFKRRFYSSKYLSDDISGYRSMCSECNECQSFHVKFCSFLIEIYFLI